MVNIIVREKLSSNTTDVCFLERALEVMEGIITNKSCQKNTLIHFLICSFIHPTRMYSILIYLKLLYTGKGKMSSFVLEVDITMTGDKYVSDDIVNVLNAVTVL